MTHILRILCVATLFIILALGLWPFRSPQNGVAWLPNQNGLYFGRYATVFSAFSFPVGRVQDKLGATLEIWLQPRRIWDSGTFLTFYRPDDRSKFALRQSGVDLLLNIDDRPREPTAVWHIDNCFPRGRAALLTITCGAQGTCIYRNGILLKQSHFPLSSRDFAGLLVLGDSPRQPDSWQGRLLGVAIYSSQLTATQVLENYTAWTEHGRPLAIEDERNVALYPFAEHTGHIIRDRSCSGLDLYIPEKYRVLDKIALEPVWSEFELSRSYFEAAVKNIVGFVPFGFCFYAYLAAMLPNRRATVVTVLLGTAVSITIEVLQAFLPTRDSGTTDIITNTFGTWLGVQFFRLAASLVPRLFLRLGLPVS